MAKRVSRFSGEYDRRVRRVSNSRIPCRVQPPPPANEIASKPMVAGDREAWTPCVPVATSVNQSVGLVFRALVRDSG